MKRLLLLMFLISTSNIKGQNIIPNSGELPKFYIISFGDVYWECDTYNDRVLVNPSIPDNCDFGCNSSGIKVLSRQGVMTNDFYYKFCNYLFADPSSTYTSSEDFDVQYILRTKYLEFGVLYTINLLTGYEFPTLSDLAFCRTTAMNATGTISIGITPPRPNRIILSDLNNAEITTSLTEGDFINIGTSSYEISFPNQDSLYGYEIEYSANNLDSWKLIDKYPFRVPYSILTQSTKEGRKIYFRSRIFRKTDDSDVKYSPYFYYSTEVLKRISVYLKSVDPSYCKEKFALSHFIVDSIEQGDTILFVKKGLSSIEDTILGTATIGNSDFKVNLPVGTYSLYIEYWGVIDSNGSFSLKLYKQIPISFETENIIIGTKVSITDVSCYGGRNGKIEIKANDGFPNYHFKLDSESKISESETSFSDLSTGLYTITITDSKGCSKNVSNIRVNQPSEVKLGTINITPVRCNSENNGMISLSTYGGTKPYSFQLSGGNASATWQTDSVFKGLKYASDYKITITDNKGCLMSSSLLTVSQPEILNLSIASSTNVSCFGGKNGTVLLSATGGTPVYQYKKDNLTWGSEANYDTLSSGKKNFYLIDANNCKDNLEVIIEQPNKLILDVESITQPLCFGNNNGKVKLKANGGVKEYEFSYDGNDWQTDSLFNGLSSGLYSFRIKDSNFCTNSVDLNIDQPKVLNITIDSFNDVKCYGGNDGTFTVKSLGGTQPYLYSDDYYNWRDINYLSNLITGDYTIYVQDKNGCESSISKYINQPESPLTYTTSKVDITCFDAKNGVISVNANGGTPNYYYSYDNGSTYVNSNTINGLLPGIYTVNVKDVNNCIASAVDISINQPLRLEATFNKKDLLCHDDDDGIININASGGTSPYYFSKDNGLTFISSTYLCKFEGLRSNSYSIVVKDKKGCILTLDPILITQPELPLGAIITKKDIDCYDAKDGAISIAASGGTLPYRYSVDNGLTFTNFSRNTQYVFNGLNALNYIVAVKDTNGCAISPQNIAITQPTLPFKFSISNAKNVSCFGGNDGSIEVKAEGGTSPYRYSFDNGKTFIETNTLGNLVPSKYTISVIDAKSCPTIPKDITIIQPTKLEVALEKKDITCHDAGNGIISLEASGGTAGYRFSIDGGANYVLAQRSFTFADLQSKFYTPIVYDQNGCDFRFSSLLLKQPEYPLSASITQKNINCYAAKDGVITVNSSGGTPPYSYSIDNGLTFTNFSRNSQYVFDGLDASNYLVALKDTNGCSINPQNIAITQPAEIFKLSILNANNVRCFGGNDGSVEVITEGGTPYQNTEYLYSLDGQNWNQSTVTYKFERLKARIDTFRVKDSKNCYTSIVHQVTQPIAVNHSVVIKNVTCYGESNGLINVGISGGIAPYCVSLELPDLFGQAFDSVNQSIDFTDLAKGTYTLQVMDRNGCNSQSTYQVLQPDSPLSLNIKSVLEPTCFGYSDGTIIIDSLGGWGGYQFKILTTNNINKTGIFKGMTAGNYHFRIEDKMGCTFDKGYVFAGTR